MENIFLFDVESIGLHGKGFAFGAVVMSILGDIIETCSGACLNTDILNQLNKIDWFKNEGKDVIEECKKLDQVESLKELRDKFFTFYMKHKTTCDIYSDVNYPVETNFLEACFQDDKSREWDMPYPLLDAANHIPNSIDRIAHYKEAKAIWPKKHNPLWDAIASGFCLINFKTR